MLETRSAGLNAANIDAFRQGLRELGYVEGQNFVIEYRSSEGRDERFGALAAELTRSSIDVILTRGTPAALAAKKATRTIPVVMAGAGDPVSSGLVAQLGRPGGNVTGLSSLIPVLNAKRLELLKEHRAASFVDRILKGAKPAELPVEQPSRFELFINLRAAKTLGLTIPPSLLLRADQVVE
jgi:ABC-type uncharacterized transport system substrate-binding protein